MEIENCQIRGQVSQRYNHRMDFDGPRRDWQENKRPPGQTSCGHKSGNIRLMHRNAKRSRSGQLRNQSSRMPEDCVVFTSLIVMMRNWRISWRMLVESWKFRCQPQCLANFNKACTKKLVAQLENTRQNMFVLLKPTNLWGYAYKVLITRIMTIILQEKVWIHWVTITWFANLFFCLKQWKYQTADESQKQRWGDRWSKERGQNNTLCIVNGSLSSQEFGVGATVSKIQRSSRTSRWHCERWSRIICIFYWAGIISITNDGCKSNG